MFGHLEEQGRVRMVDMSERHHTARFARAGARVFTTHEVIDRIRLGQVAKGSVIEAARTAGIQAARRAAELIPPRHPPALDRVDVQCTLRDARAHVEASARTTAPAGAEMEAITAASVAALTIYEMCKALDPAMALSGVRLLEKSGGRSGRYRRSACPPMVSFVAPSGTGKTTYLEALIAALADAGLRVGTIKHDAHDFELDHEGKDSYLHRAAGAVRVVLASEWKLGVHGDRPPCTTLLDLAAYLDDVDVILVEGYRDAGLPVVLVTRQGAPSPPYEPPASTVAVVGDGGAPDGIPRLSLDDPAPMVAFLQAQLGVEPRRGE